MGITFSIEVLLKKEAITLENFKKFLKIFDENGIEFVEYKPGSPLSREISYADVEKKTNSLWNRRKKEEISLSCSFPIWIPEDLETGKPRKTAGLSDVNVKNCCFRLFSDTIASYLGEEKGNEEYNIYVRRNKEYVTKIVEEIVNRLPAFRLLAGTEYNLLSAEYEYYSDPYLFCIEEGLNYDGYKFDFERIDNKKLNEIKKVLSEEELKELIRQYSDKMLNAKQGIGIIRNVPGPLYESHVFPRYFIRKEVRKRGIELEEGLAEKYAKELGIE